jgi:hypothetical protein
VTIEVIFIWIEFRPQRRSPIYEQKNEPLPFKVLLLIPRAGRSKKNHDGWIIIISKATKVPTRSLSRKLHPIAYCIFILPKAVATIPMI